ncbi:MAG TPA: OmpA family protein [Polyangia bacterium]|jgi:chemotaxis protein MotB|nr:OmpA family protein [Polyangia bacterium]
MRPLYQSLALALTLALPLVALGGAGCGVNQELYNARVNELEKMKAQLDMERKASEAAQKNIKDLEKERDELKATLTSLGSTASKSEAELAEARKRVEELRKAQEQAELRNKQFRDLVSKFKAMVDSGKLKVEIRNGLMLVKLADNILFDPGKTDLKKEGKDALKEVTRILADIQDRKFQVAGHTDNQGLARGGRFKDNWELSTARAVEVLHFMVKDGGMPAERISAAGFADQLPVAKNDSEDGRRQNRRIEIVLLPNIEDLPPLEDQVSK